MKEQTSQASAMRSQPLESRKFSISLPLAPQHPVSCVPSPRAEDNVREESNGWAKPDSLQAGKLMGNGDAPSPGGQV